MVSALYFTIKVLAYALRRQANQIGLRCFQQSRFSERVSPAEPKVIDVIVKLLDLLKCGTDPFTHSLSPPVRSGGLCCGT